MRINGKISGGVNVSGHHGTTNSKGVAILVKENLGIDIITSFSDNAGRYIVVQFKYHSELFCLVNLYAPNNDAPQFFSEIFSRLEKLEGHKILTGDFNLVLNTELDRNHSSINNDKSQLLLMEYMENHCLCDIWRDRNPNRKHYTWKRNKPTKQASRIDLCLVPQAISAWIERIEIKQSIRSDHMLLECEIIPDQSKKGPGIWKFNNTHLQNKRFIDYMNEVIDRNIKSTHDLKLDSAQMWEHIKLAIIYHAQQFSREEAYKKVTNVKFIEENIKTLLDAESLNDEDAQLLEKYSQDLETMNRERTLGAIFRSRAQWYNEGEKNTKYFFNLEKSRSGAKNMSKVIKNDGSEVTDQKEILAELKLFYESLYTSDPNVKFQEVNDTNICLSDQHSKELEGDIEAVELTTALKSLKRNKCPGGDGLTAELYVVFWAKLRNLLTEALNFAYKKGELHRSALTGVISLIPKKNKDNRIVANMRPITLLNVDYKLLEKVLANRLKPALQQLVNEDQKGFLPDRYIGANIRRVLDIMENSNANRSSHRSFKFRC